MFLRALVVSSLSMAISWPHLTMTAPAGVSEGLDNPESTSTQAPTTTPPRGYVYPKFICPVGQCYRMHESAEGLKRHLVQSHSADPDMIYTAPGLYEEGSFIYRCTECGRSFQSRRRFADHFDEPPHVPSGRFVCPQCGDRVVHESVDQHREHLVLSHVAPKLWRGEPNNAAKGEADGHESRPAVPFLPLINTRQLISGIASRSNGAIVRKTLATRQCGRLPERGQTETSATSGPQQQRPPSENLAIEAWPSINAGNVQRVVVPTQSNAGVDGNAANGAAIGHPATPSTHAAGHSTGTPSDTHEEPLWFRTYSRQGVPIPHRFAFLSADNLGDDDISEAIPQVGIFARAGPSAREPTPAAGQHRPLCPPIPPRTYPRRPLWLRSGQHSRGSGLPVRDRSPLNRGPEAAPRASTTARTFDESHQDREVPTESSAVTGGAVVSGDEVEIIIDSDDSSDDVELISHVVAVSDEDDDVVMVDVNPDNTSEDQRRASPTPPFRTTVSDACRLGLLDCAPHPPHSSTSGFSLQGDEEGRDLLSPLEEEREQGQGVSAQAGSTTSTPTFDDHEAVPCPASSTTPNPRESPENLSGGSSVLGGLVCIWAFDSRGRPRQKRSLQVQPIHQGQGSRNGYL